MVRFIESFCHDGTEGSAPMHVFPAMAAPTPREGAMSLWFDLDLLRTLVTVVDCGGSTRASERLCRTPSTVGLQIKRIEHAG